MPHQDAGDADSAGSDGVHRMVTCVVEYAIDPTKIGDSNGSHFERFAKLWIRLVHSHRVRNHACFPPSEPAGSWGEDRASAATLPHATK